MKKFNIFIMAALLATPTFMPSARAVVTQRQMDGTFSVFSGGELKNVSLSNDGHLQLAPGMTNLASLDDPIIWAAVKDKKGDLFFGTGDRGKVYKLTPKGELSTFFEPNAVMVHALAIDEKGRVYAATSPNGCVYRLDTDGRAEMFCNPGETYVWAMTFGDDGSLYLATGDHGKILRIPPGGSTPAKAETFFETKEANITSLAWDHDGNLLAGSNPHGFLYRIQKRKDGSARGFVLFNSGDKEIKQIAVAPDGVIYASTFVSNPKSEAPPEEGPITIAISAAPATGGEESRMANTIIKATQEHGKPGIKPPGGIELLQKSSSDDDSSDGGSDASDNADPGGDPSSIVSLINESSPDGKSFGAIYRIATNGFCDHYWSVPDEAIYAMILLPDGTLLAGTGNKGRIYSISDANHWKLLQETGDGSQLAALLPDARHPERICVATSHPAQIFRLDLSLADNGTYTSKPFDAREKSQWGKMHPLGDVPRGAQLELSTRSGNTPRPDKTWSEWSDPKPMVPQIAVASPNARYFQYRLEFKRNADSPGAGASLRQLTWYYQNLNAPPVISRIKVHNEGFSISKMPMPEMEGQPANLNDLLGGSDNSSKAGGQEEIILSMMAQGQLKMNKIPGYCTVVWKATDPNGDKLTYSVAVRAEAQTHWTTLVNKTEDTFYSFDTKGFPGGIYFIKVTASDLPSNTPETACLAQAISEPFLINNAPPTLSVQNQTVEKDHARIVVNVVDASSVISSASYSADGKEEVALRPDDLIFDSTNETFTIELNGLAKGAHSLLVHAADEAKNTAVLQVSFETR